MANAHFAMVTMAFQASVANCEKDAHTPAALVETAFQTVVTIPQAHCAAPTMAFQASTANCLNEVQAAPAAAAPVWMPLQTV